MPGSRHADQTNISVWIDKKLLAAIERARKKMRSMERSQFIRDAIKEKLESLHIEVPDEIVLKPDRASPILLSEPAATYGQSQSQSQTPKKKK